MPDETLDTTTQPKEEPVITVDKVMGSLDWNDGKGPIPVELTIQTTTHPDGRVDKVVGVPTIGLGTEDTTRFA